MQKALKICGLILFYLCIFARAVYADPAATVPGFEDKANVILDKMKLVSLYVGIALSIWGAWEWQIGSPSGWERIKKAFFGYIMILLIPTLFYWARDAFSSF